MGGLGSGGRRGGITLGCLGEDLNYVIEGDEVDVPSAGVSLEIGKLAADFFGVFLEIWSPLVLQSFADLAILGLVVSDGRNCILDCSG